MARDSGGLFRLEKRGKPGQHEGTRKKSGRRDSAGHSKKWQIRIAESKQSHRLGLSSC